MELISTVSELKKIIEDKKKQGETIGFVPTMGALHKGHLTLVELAGKATGFVVVSIFVNPTQFNDKNDLDRYPRDLEADIKLLKTTPCRLVFVPTVSEVYPENDNRVFDFGNIDKVMEGKFRPGHFNGVAQVVSKLFDMVQPHKAFFGEKDFQQLAIIKAMAHSLQYDIEIVPCATVREPDGLAMSSRNQLLSPEQRDSAALISKTLYEVLEKKNIIPIDELSKWVIETINSDKNLETEYFEIVNSNSLETVNSWDEKVNKTACIAVHCGSIRLIDNVTF